ncbi:MAG: FtsW/RodA/SpoVE family cell cycle protein [Porphyromonadaceae bacterium]|jgi:cell division protein FtsW|nr:FtsW/RodA/SpoVE family cell cycle protein [Porphyromonadaceae bacterium]
MNKKFTKYLKGDTVIWIIFFTLCGFSILELYSASSTLAYSMGNHAAPIFQHVFFLLTGAALAFAIHFVPYKYIRILAYLGIVVSFILLLYLLAKGESINSASRWIKIFGIQFQPSEIAKLSLIVVVADLISRIRANPALENKYFYWILGISGVIIGLILFENFSTAFILGVIVFSMMFIGQVSFKKLGIIIASILFLILLGVVIVKTVPKEKMPDMFERVYTWEKRISRTQQETNETRYVINDENLQVQHGRIAVARGGFFGVYPGNSIERDYLPHAYDDFIFAIIIEELGLFGGILIMLLYLWLLFRTGQIATVCRSTFPAMLVTGLGLLITLQAAVNMFVGSGFGLVTGQPLPLISRGGTSIMITSVYFGIILGVIREIKSTEEKRFKQQNPVVEDLEKSDALTLKIDDI